MENSIGKFLFSQECFKLTQVQFVITLRSSGYSVTKHSAYFTIVWLMKKTKDISTQFFLRCHKNTSLRWVFIRLFVCFVISVLASLFVIMLLFSCIDHPSYYLKTLTSIVHRKECNSPVKNDLESRHILTHGSGFTLYIFFFRM